MAWPDARCGCVRLRGRGAADLSSAPSARGSRESGTCRHRTGRPPSRIWEEEAGRWPGAMGACRTSSLRGRRNAKGSRARASGRHRGGFPVHASIPGTRGLSRNASWKCPTDFRLENVPPQGVAAERSVHGARGRDARPQEGNALPARGVAPRGAPRCHVASRRTDEAHAGVPRSVLAACSSTCRTSPEQTWSASTRARTCSRFPRSATALAS